MEEEGVEGVVYSLRGVGKEIGVVFAILVQFLRATHDRAKDHRNSASRSAKLPRSALPELSKDFYSGTELVTI
jgi:hypothetical protein